MVEYKRTHDLSVQELGILKDENEEITRISNNLEKQVARLETKEVHHHQELARNQDAVQTIVLENEKLLHRTHQLEQDKVLLEEKMDRLKSKLKEKMDADILTYAYCRQAHQNSGSKVNTAPKSGNWLKKSIF